MTETLTVQTRKHEEVAVEEIKIEESRGVCRVYAVNKNGALEYLCQFDAMVGSTIDGKKNRANANAFVAAFLGPGHKNTLTLVNDLGEVIPKRQWIRPQAPASASVYVSGPLQVTRSSKTKKWTLIYHNTENGQDKYDRIESFPNLPEAKTAGERWYYTHMRKIIKDRTTRKD